MTAEQAADENTAEFVHAALVIGADDDLSAVLLPALRRWVERYDEVFLVVGEHTRAVLAEEAADLAGALRWGEPAAFYQRLGFAYEGFRRHLVFSPVTSVSVEVPIHVSLGRDLERAGTWCVAWLLGGMS